MRWKVEIADFAGNPRLLRDVLERLSISVNEADGKCFLVAEQYETQDTAGEVRALASGVSAIINDIAANDPEIDLGFAVGDVLEQGPDGLSRRHQFATIVEVAHITATAGVIRSSVTSEPVSEIDRARLEEERREREYQLLRRKAIARVISACRNPRARQVQRLLGADLTPLTMGHIVELIQADIGGAMKDLISLKKLRRFDRSINHPDVYGEDARHIVKKQEAPPKPMALDEAQLFVCELARRWFKRIAGSSART